MEFWQQLLHFFQLRNTPFIHFHVLDEESSFFINKEPVMNFECQTRQGGYFVLVLLAFQILGDLIDGIGIIDHTLDENLEV